MDFINYYEEDTEEFLTNDIVFRSTYSNHEILSLLKRKLFLMSSNSDDIAEAIVSSNIITYDNYLKLKNSLKTGIDLKKLVMRNDFKVRDGTDKEKAIKIILNSIEYKYLKNGYKYYKSMSRYTGKDSPFYFSGGVTISFYKQGLRNLNNCILRPYNYYNFVDNLSETKINNQQDLPVDEYEERLFSKNKEVHINMPLNKLIHAIFVDEKEIRSHNQIKKLCGLNDIEYNSFKLFDIDTVNKRLNRR